MARNKVELCGVDTSKLPVLTNAQMQALFARIHAGDEGALLREIRSFAQTYAEVILKKEDGLLCSGAGDSEQEAEALAEELSSFVEELHASGQTVSDWDFSLSEQMDQEDFDFLEHLMEDLAVRDQYLQLYDQM